MRRILTLISALAIAQVAFAQPQVEMKLFQGASDDLVDVRFRAAADVAACSDFIGASGFSVVWDDASGITDVNVAVGGDCGCPGYGDQGFGWVAETPVALVDGSNRTGVVIGLGGNPCLTFTPFALTGGDMEDDWVTVATLQVVGATPDGGALSAGGLKITDVGDPGIPGSPDNPNPNWPAFVEGYYEGLWSITVLEGSLPVTLLSFEAEKKGERSVSLEWSTADEFNTSHFVIERSRDGKEWEDLGSVDAAGESTETLNYTFIDKNAYNGRSAQARFYYRLRMLDNDASFSYSEIEAVVFKSEGPGSEVYAYPNPSSIGLNVEFNGENRIPARMELFDASGKIVYSTVLPEGTEIEYIDYSRLSITSGTYILRVLDQSKETISAQKIIVSR